MKNNKILHIATIDKFIPSFIKLIRENFNLSSHKFITFGKIERYPYNVDVNTEHFSAKDKLKMIYRLLFCIHTHDKILLHGLFSFPLIAMLSAFPWLHKKCYWIIWGGDLYYHEAGKKDPFYKAKEFFRRKLISRIGGIVTYVDGDYQRAVDWYDSNANKHECIMYMSNVFIEKEGNKKHSHNKDKIILLVGNSADPENNHFDIFDKIIKSVNYDEIEKIYCPLSYGSVSNGIKVRLEGERLFGNKFFPLMSFLDLNKYNEILDTIDIAVFAHDRQQAMGNTINLLGRGKKIILKNNTSSWEFFLDIGINTSDFDNFDLTKIQNDVREKNKKIIVNYFSKENLINQLKAIFH